MFIENKYHDWYFLIIDKARSQDRQKGQVYYETHHIIPKCMSGTNQKSNLVLLTAKEHFVCHWLLTKMMVSKKHQYQMNNAFACFIQNPNQQRHFTALEYQKIREAKWKSKGRKKPDGFGEKIRIALTGTKLSEIRKQKISHAHKGKKHDPIVILRRANTNRALWTTEKKISAGGKSIIIADRLYPSLRTASKELGLTRTVIKKTFNSLNDQLFTQEILNQLIMRKKGPYGSRKPKI